MHRRQFLKMTGFAWVAAGVPTALNAQSASEREFPECLRESFDLRPCIERQRRLRQAETLMRHPNFSALYSRWELLETRRNGGIAPRGGHMSPMQFAFELTHNPYASAMLQNPERAYEGTGLSLIHI